VASESVTLADVAAQAGVSKMTVSKVINRKPGLKDSTRERVMEAVEQLGYTVHASARALAGGRTETLGVLVPSLYSQYLSEIIRGVDRTALKAGMELLISTTRRSNEQRNTGRLAQGLVDGLLIVLPDPLAIEERTLQSLNLPVVIIAPNSEAEENGCPPMCPTVDADHYTGARLAMDHLLSLGHRRIGMISSNRQMSHSVKRVSGYREGLLTAGLPLDPELEIEGDFTQRTGFNAARTLLNLRDPPTAIFAVNDVSAFGAIEAIKDHGLRVPEDVSVIGFDDIPQASQVHPPLTTIRQPLLEMGTAGTRLLLALIQGVEAVTDRLIIPTELVVRSSTGPPRTRPTGLHAGDPPPGDLPRHPV
jgi:LacI family transcriptional regulator